MPGGYNVEALDIWAEGVRFPAVKVWDRGRERRDVVYLLKTNNRTPTFIGDIRAQIGAAQLGAKRLKEIIARHGSRAVRGAVDFGIDYAARRFREEVSAWRDGSYESDVYVDHDPKGNLEIHVHCKVTVRGRAPDGRLHRLGHAPRAAGLVDLRQHARLRGLAAGLDDGSRDSEERGLLRRDRADRARGMLPESDARPLGGGGNPPPGRRGGRGDRARAGAGDPRARLPADLQGRHAGDPVRHAPGDAEDLRRSLGRFDRGLLRRRARPGRLGLRQRRLREPDQGDRGDQRVDLPDPPRAPRLQPGQRRAREVARLPGLAVREAAHRAGQSVHLSGRHEVSDAGDRRRQATAARIVSRCAPDNPMRSWSRTPRTWCR